MHALKSALYFFSCPVSVFCCDDSQGSLKFHSIFSHLLVKLHAASFGRTAHEKKKKRTIISFRSDQLRNKVHEESVQYHSVFISWRGTNFRLLFVSWTFMSSSGGADWFCSTFMKLIIKFFSRICRLCYWLEVFYCYFVQPDVAAQRTELTDVLGSKASVFKTMLSEVVTRTHWQKIHQ